MRTGWLAACVPLGAVILVCAVGTSAQETPSGAGSILFVDEGSLWVAASDGHGRQRLASGYPLEKGLLPPWLLASPSGRKAFLVCPDEARAYCVEGSRLRPLGLVDPEPSQTRAVWSANEDWVVVSHRSALWVVSAEDGRRHSIASPTADVGTDYPLGWCSPTELAFIRHVWSSEGEPAGTTIWGVSVSPLDHPRPARPIVEFGGRYRAHAVSLDGRFVALWVGNALFVVSLETGEWTAAFAALPNPDEPRPCDMRWLPEGDVLVSMDCPPGDEDCVSDLRIATGTAQELLAPTEVEGHSVEVPGLDPLAHLSSGLALLDRLDLPPRMAWSAMPPEYWLAPPDPAGLPALLKVVAESPGAEVYVNGEFQGPTPLAVTTEASDAWAQHHWVALLEDDRAVVAREVFLRGGQHEELGVESGAPLAAPDEPQELAQLRNAVRKAIVHQDMGALLRCVPRQGITFDCEVTRERWSRERLRRVLEKQGSWEKGALDRCRTAFLTGLFGDLTDNRWGADLDAYGYCWLVFAQVGGRWQLTEIGSGSVNE